MCARERELTEREMFDIGLIYNGDGMLTAPDYAEASGAMIHQTTLLPSARPIFLKAPLYRRIVVLKR